MIAMAILDQKAEEMKYLVAGVKEQAARLTEDYWEIRTALSVPEFVEIFKDHPLMDFSCYDITLDGAIEKLVELRKDYGEMGLLLIADTHISPLAYLKPGIKADALLMRPLARQTMVDTLKEFFVAHFESRKLNGENKFFIVESKDGRLSVPYKDIYYFEAREKKIFLRTFNEEYGFYTTLDRLCQDIPANFARCHRSYLVNTDKIKQLLFAQNRIILTDGFEIPLSRSYKPMLKEFWK
ncbi:MAG: LytTR family transcriptional regulator DNA-binding domain-containing protein [Lachnospiraceae bacterium]|nr:LytTR family transcriptional regulator DNA-binding domain-containing protein [Lachnospiraceae bacterium]